MAQLEDGRRLLADARGSGRPAACSRPWRNCVSLTRAGRLRPVVGGSYPLAAARDAHEALLGRGTTGKLVLTVELTDARVANAPAPWCARTWRGVRSRGEFRERRAASGRAGGLPHHLRPRFPTADMQQRAARYLMSMGIRTLCVILVIIVPGPLRWVFAVGAIVLPYIAVVAANAAGERRERPLQPPPPMERPSLTGVAPRSRCRGERRPGAA